MQRHLLAVLAPGILAASAGATVLTFDPFAGCDRSLDNTECEGANLPQEYGDRVTSLSQGGFSYGGEGGPTPNVEVQYAGRDPEVSAPQIWLDHFGDLDWALDNNTDPPNFFDITFAADSGFEVLLTSLDVARLNERFFPGEEIDFSTVIDVRVFDGDGALLFEQLDLSVAGEEAHTSIDFGGVSASTLRLSFDLTRQGIDSDLIGFDNIVFSQIPEPTTGALLGLGLVGLAVRRRS